MPSINCDLIINLIKPKLSKIIDSNIAEFRSSGSFKVRPGYGYDKFYLDRIDGSYDMSLYSLIHYIMYEDDLYALFLNQTQMKDLKGVIKNTPESIYSLEDGDKDHDFINYEILDNVYHQLIVFVGQKLIDLGFDVREDFSEYLIP
jgi:hypothetical protein